MLTYSAGEDFVIGARRVVFSSAVLSVSASLLFIDDMTAEGTEFFSLKLEPPQGITIVNNTDIVVFVVDDDDPCEAVRCHERAVCIINGSAPLCKCVYPFVGDGISCQLQNPCFPHACHENATCVLENSGSGSAKPGLGSAASSSESAASGSESAASGSESAASGSGSAASDSGSTESIFGSGTCQCDPPYIGNGTSCNLPDPCAVGLCSPNAECESVLLRDRVEANCTCLPSFIGNGITCIRKCI